MANNLLRFLLAVPVAIVSIIFAVIIGAVLLLLGVVFSIGFLPLIIAGVVLFGMLGFFVAIWYLVRKEPQEEKSKDNNFSIKQGKDA